MDQRKAGNCPKKGGFFFPKVGRKKKKKSSQKGGGRAADKMRKGSQVKLRGRGGIIRLERLRQREKTRKKGAAGPDENRKVS